MSIQDLQTFTLGIPQYRPAMNSQLYSAIIEAKIPLSRQIIGSSSEIRFCRNFIVGEFLWNEKCMGKSDVLLFCDQDTVPNPSDFELLVTACSSALPIIGSNMVYRHSSTTNNWFFRNDTNGAKKQDILDNYEMTNRMIQVDYIGFGLVAIHRKALEKMTDTYGGAQQGGGKKIPVLFSEMRTRKLKDTQLEDEMLIASLKKTFKEKGFSDEQFQEVEKALLYHWVNRWADNIFPETFSFCERARELKIPIHVHLGVRPGHLTEVPLFAEFPSSEPPASQFASIVCSGDMHYSSQYI